MTFLNFTTGLPSRIDLRINLLLFPWQWSFRPLYRRCWADIDTYMDWEIRFSFLFLVIRLERRMDLTMFLRR